MNPSKSNESVPRSFPKSLIVAGIIMLVGALIYLIRPVDQKPSGIATLKSASLVGQVFQGTVSGINEDGEGFIMLPDDVVTIPGVDLGQRIEFRIADDTGRFVRADFIRSLPNASGYAAPPEPKEENRQAMPDRPAPVKVGDTIDVDVAEADRRNPEVNGVARINGFVVFVPGAKIGERVKINITRVMARAADSVVVERLGSSPENP